MLFHYFSVRAAGLVNNLVALFGQVRQGLAQPAVAAEWHTWQGVGLHGLQGLSRPFCGTQTPVGPKPHGTQEPLSCATVPAALAATQGWHLPAPAGLISCSLLQLLHTACKFSQPPLQLQSVRGASVLKKIPHTRRLQHIL